MWGGAHNGVASSPQISGDWPLPHPEPTSLSLLTNQSSGLAESVMWNSGLLAQRSESRAPFEAKTHSSPSFSGCLAPTELLFFLYSDTHCWQTPAASHTPSHTLIFVQQDTDTHHRELLPWGIYTLDCCYLWINDLLLGVCVLRTGLALAQSNWTLDTSLSYQPACHCLLGRGKAAPVSAWGYKALFLCGGLDDSVSPLLHVPPAELRIPL